MSDKHKHLDYIQAAIARMATNSFLFKGWAVTIAAGLAAVGVINNRSLVLAVAVVTTFVFWGLDGYYLWLERGFIALYQAVVLKREDEIDFGMRVNKTEGTRRWLRTCGRAHLVVFYGALIAADIVGIVIVRTR